MKTGIITWHHGGNFGSVLQALALSETLKELGHDAEVINYLPSPYGQFTPLRNKICYILSKFSSKFTKKVYPQSDSFREQNVSQSPALYNLRALRAYSEKYDVVICGSDQIWAPNVLNEVYFANFVSPKTRKISYAASLGLNNLPTELVIKYQKNLKDFYAISVREDKGKTLLKKKCQIDSEVCLDPTLLHDQSFYIRYETELKCIDEKYIFCYFLNSNSNYFRIVTEYAKINNLKILYVTPSGISSRLLLGIKDLSPASFLWLIHNAQCVFTDSYHGTIFSMLYHKSFFTFKRFEDNDWLNQNSRLDQLNKYFGLSPISTQTKLSELHQYIFNYENFDERLNNLKDQSIEYLKRSLNNA